MILALSDRADKCEDFRQKDPREVLFFEFFRNITEFKMAENIDFFTFNPFNGLRYAWNFVSTSGEQKVFAILLRIK